MREVNKREKQAGIIPEPDIDTYMKVNNMQKRLHSLLCFCSTGSLAHAPVGYLQ